MRKENLINISFIFQTVQFLEALTNLVLITGAKSTNENAIENYLPAALLIYFFTRS